MKKIINILMLTIITIVLVGCNNNEEVFTYTIDGRVSKISNGIAEVIPLRESEINSDIIKINVISNIEVGDYINIKYEKIENDFAINSSYIKIPTVTFSGTIESIEEENAVIKVDSNESYILSSGDRVVVKLNSNTEYKVNEHVLIEYNGEINESYPIIVNVIDIHKLIID